MTRVKRGTCARHRRHKILKLNRSFSGVHSRLFRQAKQQRMKALRSSFVNRKEWKRESRRLWIQRIQASLRAPVLRSAGTNQYTYSDFIHLLKKNNIIVNRKILAQLAIFDRQAFSQLVTSVGEN
jgi:large subunit ribosomal protein L20